MGYLPTTTTSPTSVTSNKTSSLTKGTSSTNTNTNSSTTGANTTTTTQSNGLTADTTAGVEALLTQIVQQSTPEGMHALVNHLYSGGNIGGVPVLSAANTPVAGVSSLQNLSSTDLNQRLTGVAALNLSQALGVDVNAAAKIVDLMKTTTNVQSNAASTNASSSQVDKASKITDTSAGSGVSTDSGTTTTNTTPFWIQLMDSGSAGVGVANALSPSGSAASDALVSAF